MRLAISSSGWLEHLHRGLVSMQHPAGQYLLPQRIYHRLQLHTSGAHSMPVNGCGPTQ